MAKATARNGTKAMVVKKLRATACCPTFWRLKFLAVSMTILIYLTTLAFTRPRSEVLMFHIPSRKKSRIRLMLSAHRIHEGLGEGGGLL